MIILHSQALFSGEQYLSHHPMCSWSNAFPPGKMDKIRLQNEALAFAPPIYLSSYKRHADIESNGEALAIKIRLRRLSKLSRGIHLQ